MSKLLNFKHFDKFSELPMARSFLCSYSRLMKLNLHGVKVFGGGEIRRHTLVLVGLKSHSRSFLSIDEIKIIMETNVPAHTSQFF